MNLNWREEILKFREWAKEQEQVAEWECNYEEWQPIYQGVEEFLGASITQSWTAEETKDLLYILARDWECQIIADHLQNHQPEAAFYLASYSLKGSDWDARWQLAAVLGHLSPDARIEPLLLQFVDDEEEYVRRRALQSLARINSKQTEQLTVREWTRDGENQQWARIGVLWVLSKIHSPLFESYLLMAELEKEQLYLVESAQKLRRGETIQ